MRYLLLMTLFASGCANQPVQLTDGLGELSTDEPVLLSDIDFTDQGVSLGTIEDCLDREDVELGITCNTDGATLVLDADVWSLDPETGWAQYNVDLLQEFPWQGDVVWAWQKNKPSARWAECGCPDGCSDAQCNWEPSEDNGYVCTGQCTGSHCSDCTVELVEAVETTGPAG
jgi:hypothetical protein